jgi:SIR2-like protein
VTDDKHIGMVVSAGRALDPMVALSTSVHASPGVYALLLGSGVSTSVGISTGWQIVTDLVRRCAVASNPDKFDPVEFSNDAARDPEAWWQKYGAGTPLGYSSLLAELAPTPAARHALLAGYFEPSDVELDEQTKIPGLAHKAIAKLVSRGTIRVILTTNFDRLLERALEEEGVAPQVIHRTEQIDGATPLPHARVTVIKLHGDYADLDKRNTIDELSAYPPEVDQLLDRVLDEYGLIVSGWSGDWDVALVAALERCRSRRYPLYWCAYASPSESARRLIDQHNGVVIGGVGADDFFRDLEARLDALDYLASPLPSRDMAIAQLKRALPNPQRRIEV